MPEVMQELQEIRTLAREFAQAELRPHVEKWDHDRDFGARVMPQVAELGFFGMVIPESHGGMGFDLSTYAAALEEIAWGEPAVAYTVAQSAIAAQLIQQYGSEPLKQEWLERIASGDALPTIVSTLWSVNASRAHFGIMLGDGRFSVVPRERLNIGERLATLGLRPLELAETSAAADGESFALGADWAKLGRASVAAISVGIAQAALDHALGYAAEREQFRTKLKDFEGLQFKIADMGIRTEAARALLNQALRGGAAQQIAMAKVAASESAMWVTTNAVQIFGGYGYMRDYPVEKLMRDAKAMEMLEGGNEQLRVEIAKAYYE